MDWIESELHRLLRQQAVLGEAYVHSCELGSVLISLSPSTELFDAGAFHQWEPTM